MVAEDIIETYALALVQLLGGLAQERQTYSIIIQEENLHFGRSTRGAVSGRNHFGDVAGDGLYNIHGVWSALMRACRALKVDVVGIVASKALGAEAHVIQ